MGLATGCAVHPPIKKAQKQEAPRSPAATTSQVAEVQIKNEDVRFVRQGQPVRVKIAAYPSQKYGLVEGLIQTQAPDAQAASPGQATPSGSGSPGYKAWIALASQKLPPLHGGTGQKLEPGLAVAAEIHHGTTTVTEYLLGPVRMVAAEAGRER
jgi:hemolysin D